MEVPKLLKIPKVQLAVTLLFITLSTLSSYPLLSVGRILVLSFLFTIGTDLFFTFIRRKTLFTPFAALVTSLILTLTINPQTPWYGIFLIAAIAMGSKNFLRITNRHIFNPAATGLVLGSMLMHTSVSWWGVSFQTLTFAPLSMLSYLILLLPLLVSAMRMRRFGSIATFMICYSLFFAVINAFSLPVLFTTLLDPTVIFFTIVMLPEPMTSPVTIQRQIFYSGFIAMLVAVFTLPFLSSFVRFLPDGLLPFLLLGNVAFFKFR